MSHTNTKRTMAEMRSRILSAALCAVLIVISVSAASCAAAPTEEEALEIIGELLPKTYLLNDIYFGVGVSYTDDGSSYRYMPVTDDSPYLTEAELREATEAVFSSDYAESIFDIYLSGYSDEGTGSVIYARYIENEDRLWIDTYAEGLVTSTRTYDLDTVEITSLTSRFIIFTAQSYLDGTADEVIEITITSETTDDGSVWRINSATY
ncbi:MAG: hypothetical protein LUH54_03565 [Firmicutes bacterium]|nr:hypothetical protein [Bacillota bacterium]